MAIFISFPRREPKLKLRDVQRSTSLGAKSVRLDFDLLRTCTARDCLMDWASVDTADRKCPCLKYVKHTSIIPYFLKFNPRFTHKIVWLNKMALFAAHDTAFKRIFYPSLSRSSACFNNPPTGLSQSQLTSWPPSDSPNSNKVYANLLYI